MNTNDIIEKCAKIADDYADEQDKTVRASCVAKSIRALKSTYAPEMTDLMVFPESLNEFMDANPLPTEKDSRMTSEQIKHLVDRFLQWRLPEDFNPDNGISYKRPNYAAEVDATPSGTNLFDAAQATDMVRFMVEGMPASSLLAETVSGAMVEEALTVLLNRISKNDFRIKTEDMRAALEAAFVLPGPQVRLLDNDARDGRWIIGYSYRRPFTPVILKKTEHGWVDDGNWYHGEPDFYLPVPMPALPATPKDGRE